jgi:large subunit ribosomal protein L32
VVNPFSNLDCTGWADHDRNLANLEKIVGRACIFVATAATIVKLSKTSVATTAAPKKKTSQSKRDKRRATWRRKADLQAQRALSLGKSILSGRSTFVYPQNEDENEE